MMLYHVLEFYCDRALYRIFPFFLCLPMCSGNFHSTSTHDLPQLTQNPGKYFVPDIVKCQSYSQKQE